MNNVIIDKWQAKTSSETVVTVLPDGCRDVIFKSFSDGSNSCFVSPYFHTSKAITLLSQSHTRGFRLAPGTVINEIALFENLQNIDFDESITVELINAFSATCGNTRETLKCIEQNPTSVNHNAKKLGISTRTLQRLLQKKTGLSPHYWVRLCRIRKAGKLMTTNLPLAEIAFSVGFSDQSHMTRECVHWFGVSPKILMKRPDLFEQLNAPAFS